jgi:signal transduction histidine kinase
MKEILRLLRLSLFLRLAAGILGAVALLYSTNDPRVLAMNGLAMLPTLLVLAATFYAARRGPLGERQMRVLLVASICALAIESVLGSLYFRANFADAYMDMRRMTRGGGESLVGDVRRLVRGPLEVPSFFSLILAVLGTWMSRRGWYRWAGVAIAANLSALVAMELLELVDGVVVRLPWGPLLGQSFVLLLVCYFVGSLADLERRRRAEIEAANRQLAEQAGVRERLATSRERVRLARDLHDTLAHSLAGVAVQLDAIGALAAAGEDVRPEIVRARDAVRRGLRETRAAIDDLRTTAVEDLGLAGALRRHIDSLAPAAHAALTMHAPDAGVYDALGTDAADALFRIAQEAIHNADTHSNATAIRVSLERSNDRIALCVEDDGAGFDVAEVGTDRYGMRGMRERAEMIGAHLRIDSVVGRGTRVVVTLPMGKE